MKTLNLSIIIFIIAVQGCSIIEIKLENQATSRSISEAKKNPLETDTYRQDSKRIREDKDNLEVSTDRAE